MTMPMNGRADSLNAAVAERGAGVRGAGEATSDGPKVAQKSAKSALALRCLLVLLSFNRLLRDSLGSSIPRDEADDAPAPAAA